MSKTDPTCLMLNIVDQTASQTDISCNAQKKVYRVLIKAMQSSGL